MKKDSRCEPEIVVETNYCTVLGCPHCHTYFLQIGPMSLRLKEEVFINICQALAGITFEPAVKRVPDNVKYMSH